MPCHLILILAVCVRARNVCSYAKAIVPTNRFYYYQLKFLHAHSHSLTHSLTRLPASLLVLGFIYTIYYIFFECERTYSMTFAPFYMDFIIWIVMLWQLLYVCGTVILFFSPMLLLSFIIIFSPNVTVARPVFTSLSTINSHLVFCRS